MAKIEREDRRGAKRGILDRKMTTFGAFWALYFAVKLPVHARKTVL